MKTLAGMEGESRASTRPPGDAAMKTALCWLLMTACAGFPEMQAASKARVLWELRFSAIFAAGPSQSKDLLARDLAYSPDGNWIAALVGPLRTHAESQDDLVLIPSTGRIDQVRRIHLDHIAAYTFYSKAVFWSPDSVHVAVRLSTRSFTSSYTIFRVTDGKLIYRGRVIDEFLGFIDNRRFLVRPANAVDNGPASSLQDQPTSIFDLDEGQQSAQALPGTMRAAVFGPPAIAGIEVSSEKRLVLVDPLTGKIVRRDPVPPDFPRVQFGDSGKIYCLGRWPTRTVPLPVRCFDVLTGKESLPMEPIRNGEPFDLARDAPVLAATDSYVAHRVFHVFDETDQAIDVRSVVVWNLRRGVELVRLKGQRQRQRASQFEVPRDAGEERWDRAAKLALGPKGDRLAIAADDVFSMYEMPTE